MQHNKFKTKRLHTKFEDFVNESYYDEDEYIEPEEPPVENMSLHGTFYHGTAIQKGEDFFDTIDMDYSDYYALWVCGNESIAKEFASNRSGDGCVEICFKVEVHSDEIADIRTQEKIKELLSFYQEDDLRDIITHLREAGFVGWQTIGSISGLGTYEDVALFTKYAFRIREVSFKFPDGNWSEYMPIENGEEFFNSNFR